MIRLKSAKNAHFSMLPKSLPIWGVKVIDLTGKKRGGV